MDHSSQGSNTEVRQCEHHGSYNASFLGDLPTHKIWSRCPQCNADDVEREARQQRLREADEDRRRLEARLDSASIPKRFKTRTLENFEAVSPEQKRALACAKQLVAGFGEHLDKGTTFVFSGRPGTGKSHLACAAAQELVNRGFSVLYGTARDLFRLLRDSWRRDAELSETQVLKLVGRIDLLIIDEVGAGFGLDAERTHLFEIIDARYREVLPTIILTNLDRDGLTACVGQRAFDRLREEGLWVPFDWESFRGKASSIGSEKAYDRPTSLALSTRSG